jgi:hypothetical protein
MRRRRGAPLSRARRGSDQQIRVLVFDLCRGANPRVSRRDLDAETSFAFVSIRSATLVWHGATWKQKV